MRARNSAPHAYGIELSCSNTVGKGTRNGRYKVMVAALADGAKSMLEDAYGIWVPGVVEHSAANLRNTDSALRAM